MLTDTDEVKSNLLFTNKELVEIPRIFVSRTRVEIREDRPERDIINGYIIQINDHVTLNRESLSRLASTASLIVTNNVTKTPIWMGKHYETFLKITEKHIDHIFLRYSGSALVSEVLYHPMDKAISIVVENLLHRLHSVIDLRERNQSVYNIRNFYKLCI